MSDMSDHDHDDNDELELEPLDPEILAHQQERAKRKSREAVDSIDINAVYDQENISDPIDLEQLKQFRFTTRHLLIATAVLAMVMTLYIRLDGCMGLFVSGTIALGAGWWFVLREERRRQEALDEQRERHAQREAARRALEDGKTVPTPLSDKEVEKLKQINAEWERENTEQQPVFRFSFSMKEMLITFTIAAVMLAFVQFVGGTQNAALLLGLVAVVGLLIQTFGVELPPLVVLGWWLLLVLYILVSVWSAFGAPNPA